MLEKVVSYDHSITELGHIQVRRITRTIEDAKEISKSYHHHVLSPGDNTQGQDERSVKIAHAIWTPEVVAAYKAIISQQQSLTT